MTVNTILGSIWLISALGFFVLTLVAIWAFVDRWSHARAAIIAFTASWYLLAMDNALVRFGVRPQELNTDATTIILRAIGAVSLWWVVSIFIFLRKQRPDAEVIP